MAGPTTGSIRCPRLRRHGDCDHARSGKQRIFQPDSRGSDYFATPGDHGILTKGSGGTFVLQETNGQIEAFNANGTLNYIQDTNGNRITAGYTAGRLSSLKASNGDPATNPVVASLTIGYNAAGLIGSVQSSDGRTVTYNYDAGKHLIGVTSFDGEVTQYGYQGRIECGDQGRAGLDQVRRRLAEQLQLRFGGPAFGDVAGRRRRSGDLHLPGWAA